MAIILLDLFFCVTFCKCRTFLIMKCHKLDVIKFSMTRIINLIMITCRDLHNLTYVTSGSSKLNFFIYLKYQTLKYYLFSLHEAIVSRFYCHSRSICRHLLCFLLCSTGQQSADQGRPPHAAVHVDQQLSDSCHTLSTQSGKRSLRILEAPHKPSAIFITANVCVVTSVANHFILESS